MNTGDMEIIIISGLLTSVRVFMVPHAVKAWPIPSVYHVRLPLVSPRELWGAGAAVASAASAVRVVAMRNIVNSVCLFDVRLGGKFCSLFSSK